MARFGLPMPAASQLDGLLEALAAEVDPPTTLRTREEALPGHLADSLSGLEVEALAAAAKIADVGAGAGFPGLPLAAALPRAHVDLVEASARKCAVIARLAAAADIGNARAVPERAEAWAAGEGAGAYDAVTARAVAPLAVLVEYASPLLREGGVLVAWKGARDAGEEDAARRASAVAGLELVEVRPVVPFDGARDRHLHVYWKQRPTPEGIPRRAGMARKRPIG